MATGKPNEEDGRGAAVSSSDGDTLRVGWGAPDNRSPGQDDLTSNEVGEGESDAVSVTESSGTSRNKKAAGDEQETTTVEAVTEAQAKAKGETEELEVPTTAQEICRLKEELERKTNEAKENWDRFLRARADAENLRKRVERDLPAMVRREKRDMFLKVLDVMDNLERAIAGAESLNEGERSSVSGFIQGVQMIYRQMQGILAGEGVEPIKALDEPFDPALHEAVSSEQAEGISCEVVVEELQKGYRYQGEVLRAARVRVAVPKSHRTGTP